MNKIALHWQILIALVLAVAFGVFFSTEYKLDEKSIDLLHKKGIKQEHIEKLNPLMDRTFETQREFKVS